MLERQHECTVRVFPIVEWPIWKHLQLCETGSVLASPSDAGRTRTGRIAGVKEVISAMMANQLTVSTRAMGHSLVGP